MNNFNEFIFNYIKENNNENLDYSTLEIDTMLWKIIKKIEDIDKVIDLKNTIYNEYTNYFNSEIIKEICFNEIIFKNQNIKDEEKTKFKNMFYNIPIFNRLRDEIKEFGTKKEDIDNITKLKLNSLYDFIDMYKKNIPYYLYNNKINDDLKNKLNANYDDTKQSINKIYKEKMKFFVYENKLNLEKNIIKFIEKSLDKMAIDNFENIYFFYSYNNNNNDIYTSINKEILKEEIIEDIKNNMKNKISNSELLIQIDNKIEKLLEDKNYFYSDLELSLNKKIFLRKQIFDNIVEQNIETKQNNYTDTDIKNIKAKTPSEEMVETETENKSEGQKL